MPVLSRNAADRSRLADRSDIVSLPVTHVDLKTQRLRGSLFYFYSVRLAFQRVAINASACLCLYIADIPLSGAARLSLGRFYGHVVT